MVLGATNPTQAVILHEAINNLVMYRWFSNRVCPKMYKSIHMNIYRSGYHIHCANSTHKHSVAKYLLTLYRQANGIKFKWHLKVYLAIKE